MTVIVSTSKKSPAKLDQHSSGVAKGIYWKQRPTLVWVPQPKGKGGCCLLLTALSLAQHELFLLCDVPLPCQPALEPAYYMDWDLYKMGAEINFSSFNFLVTGFFCLNNEKNN